MRFDKLREPVAEGNAAGPDLDEEMDPDYLNYTLLASGRLPARFFGSEGQPFDRSTIDLDSEMEVIEGFLERTRDARLLTLAARFQALSGNILGFSEATQGLAIIVTTFWDEFHPRESDGDFMVRQNSVEGLDDQIQVVLPLQFAPIAGGGRTQVVSLRSFLVASGKTPAREGETTVPLDSIANTLSAETNREPVTAVHAAAAAGLRALEDIRKTFLAHDAGMFLPNFDRVGETLKGIVDLIAANRRELGPAEPEAAEVEEGPEGAPAASGGPKAVVGAVKTHAAAKAALGAVERYFLTMEPSSPALILVHQARMLIGRPLVEVLEALMPDSSSRAIMRFDAALNFDIDLTRMKSVTEHAFADSETTLAGEPVPDEAAPAAADGAAGESDDGWGDLATEGTEGGPDTSGESPAEGTDAAAELPAGAPAAAGDQGPARAPAMASAAVRFSVGSRGEASDLISSTEAFFRQVEPSSSLPMLLSKARSYMNRDFASILSELIPRES